MTAAIYAARKKINFIILSLDIGGQMSLSPEVDNYPGIPNVTGIQIVSKFNEHLKEYGIKIKNEEVLNISKVKNIIKVKTRNNTYECKTLIIASGKRPKKLNVEGEDEFLGRGVSYCATCDAPLTKGQKAAIIGSGNSGLDAALHLTKYATKVYIMEKMEKMGGDPILREKVEKDKKIQFIGGATIKKIQGNEIVNKITYEKEGKENTLDVTRIFIEIGLIAKVDFADIVKKNKWGEIMISRSTKTNEENLTNIPGIFAAGDATDIPAKQIVIAAGEGGKAVLAAFDYLNRFKEK